MIPKSLVDSHVHYWDPSRLPYGWLGDIPSLNKPFLPSDHTACAGTDVRRIIVVEAGCDPDRALDEAVWLSSLAEEDPRIAGVVAQAPLEQGVGVTAHLDQLSAIPLVRGVRRLLQGEADPGFCLDSGFIAGVALLEKYGFTMDLCIRHEQLPAVTELVTRVPGVHFILDHCGKPPVKSGALDPWRECIGALACLPNVSCKLSGLATEADWESWKTSDLHPYVRAVLENFGPERVIFGGDWPVCTLATGYRQWVETVGELTSTLSERDTAIIFHSNAERIYRL
jgi:L-fuconolactonase